MAVLVRTQEEFHSAAEAMRRKTKQDRDQLDTDGHGADSEIFACVPIAMIQEFH